MRKAGESAGEGEGRCGVHLSGKEVKYEIDAVIREKLLFSNRPRPLLR